MFLFKKEATRGVYTESFQQAPGNKLLSNQGASEIRSVSSHSRHLLQLSNELFYPSEENHTETYCYKKLCQKVQDNIRWTRVFRPEQASKRFSLDDSLNVKMKTKIISFLLRIHHLDNSVHQTEGRYLWNKDSLLLKQRCLHQSTQTPRKKTNVSVTMRLFLLNNNHNNSSFLQSRNTQNELYTNFGQCIHSTVCHFNKIFHCSIAKNGWKTLKLHTSSESDIPCKMVTIFSWKYTIFLLNLELTCQALLHC